MTRTGPGMHTIFLPQKIGQIILGNRVIHLLRARNGKNPPTEIAIQTLKHVFESPIESAQRESGPRGQLPRDAATRETEWQLTLSMLFTRGSDHGIPRHT